ncbi:MAG: LemA family protein [Alphaproteobacteria bacterium]
MWIIVGIAAVILLWAGAAYNGLIRKNNLVKEAWAGVETQLKRRADLIPNLVETVKGYAAHERATLELVTEMRAKSLQASGVADRGEAERGMSAAVAKLMAVAENYPDLKANQNFLALQTELSKTEDDIQLARRYYNGTVREFNIGTQSFPSNIIAGSFGFEAAEYFQIENDADRQAPKVSLDQRS